MQRLRQKRMAVALAKSHDAIRDLAGRLVAAQEDERKRIARELHDDLSQQIAAIGIFVSSFKRKAGPLAPAVYGSFEELQNHLRSLAAAVRQLASELYPHALEALGIGPALAKHVEEFSRRTEIRVRLDNNLDRHPIHPGIALCLFRVAQEALRNIEKHSAADQAELRLGYFAGSFQLEIKDNGRGFEAGQLCGPAGLGLTSIEERIRLVNGELRISSAPGKGTLIKTRVPDHSARAFIEDADLALSTAQTSETGVILDLLIQVLDDLRRYELEAKGPAD